MLTNRNIASGVQYHYAYKDVTALESFSRRLKSTITSRYLLAGVAGSAVSFQKSLYQPAEEPLFWDLTISEQLDRVNTCCFCKTLSLY